VPVEPPGVGRPEQRATAADDDLRAGHAHAAELLRHGALHAPGHVRRQLVGDEPDVRRLRCRRGEPGGREAPEPARATHAAAASSSSAPSTTASWVLGETFGNARAIRPSGPMMYVERVTPMYVLP
jgi:hypothetical protein